MASRQEYTAGYNNSYALVVGIDEYTHLRPLSAAVHGAKAVASHLRSELGFDVTELYNADTSREAVLRWFGELGTHPDDRVIFYFSGHGVTQSLRNRSKGFLALAESDGYWNSLGMDNILDQSDTLSAKHVLFLLDACFSGLALSGKAENFGVNRTAEYLLTRPASYAITAGGEEVVDDDGAGEYSLFTHWLLKGLKDRVLLADGILRAKEIGLFLETNVSANRNSRALPNHGYLHGSGDGDFVFSWDVGERFPYELEMALSSEIMQVRWGAVGALIEIAKNEQEALSLLARERLQLFAMNEPDARVKAAAQSLFDEEEAIRLEAEELIRREEADRRLEEARQQQEEAARKAREAEEELAAIQRRVEEDRLIAEQAELDRQAALEEALQSRVPMGGTYTGTLRPVVELVEPEEDALEPKPDLEPIILAKPGIPVWLMVGIPLIVVVVISSIVALGGGGTDPEPTEIPVIVEASVTPESSPTEPLIVADITDVPTATIEVVSSTAVVEWVEGDILFKDDFENGFVVSRWHVWWGDWSIIDDPEVSNNSVFSSTASGEIRIKNSDNWDNYIVTFRSMLLDEEYEDGAFFGISTRAQGFLDWEEGCPNIGLSISPISDTMTSVYLNHFHEDCSNFTGLTGLTGHSSSLIRVDEWFDIQIEWFGDTVQVYINGELLFRDSVIGLDHGGISFLASSVDVYIDDVVVKQAIPEE